MTTINITNKKTDVRFDNKGLTLIAYDNEYTLYIDYYGETTYGYSYKELCTAKRLSTINKYAAEYGYEFVK